MSQPPLFSLIMPAYNHEKYVAQALLSVASQNYPNIEIIVIDDGSTDKTFETIERIRPEISNKRRIICLRQQNEGVSATLNRGLAYAQGKYVGFLASDDYYLPGKVAGDVGLLEQCDGSIGVVHTNVEFLDEVNQRTTSVGSFRPAIGDCFWDLLTRHAGAWAPTVVARRDYVVGIGMHDVMLAAEDYDLWVRLAASGVRFAFRSDVTVCKRVLKGSHGHNLFKCFDVPFQILEKHKARVSEAEYKNAKRHLYKWTIRNACSQGNQELAAYAARKHEREEGDMWCQFTVGLWTLRYLIGRLLPPYIRSILKRSKLAH